MPPIDPNTPPGDTPVVDLTPAASEEEQPATPTRYALLDQAITKDQLRELRIRVFTEVEVPVEGCTSPSKLWLVGEPALRKLREARYTVAQPESIDAMPNTLYVHLTNPDGSRALAGVDPRTVKLVRVTSWVGAAPTLNGWFVEQIKQTLSPLMDLPIQIVNSNGQLPILAASAESQYFQVVIGTSPIKGWTSEYMRDNQPDRYTPPTTAWGLPIADRTASLCVEWLAGVALYSPEGIEIGAMNKQNLYIYFRGAAIDNEDARKLLRHILDLACVVYKDPAATAVPEGAARANYIQSCGGRVDAERKDAHTEMDASAARVNKLQEDIVQAVRVHTQAMAKLSTLAQTAEKLSGFLANEFELMKANVKVKRVGWRGSSLFVDTVVLCASAPSGARKEEIEYEIGEFTIAICANRGTPTFINRTRLVDAMQNAMHAPHVYADGRACLGTAIDSIPRLVAGYQWSTAIGLAIQFLESVNFVDTAGQYVTRWPLSERQRAIDRASELAKAGAVVANPAPADVSTVGA